MIEFCKQCHNEASANGNDIYYHGRNRAASASRVSTRRYYVADHFGRQCKYSHCARHCGCTREAKRQWLRFIENSQTQFVCAGCRRPSRHACVTHSGEASTPHNPTGYMSQRYCGVCCNMCHAGHCTRAAAAEYSPCIRCNIVTLSTLHGMEGCFRCNDSFWGCPRCFRLLDTPATRSNDIRCRDCARCIMCCGCENNTGRLRLHTCDLYRGHIEDERYMRTSTYNPVKRTMGVEMEICGFASPPRGSLAKLYNTCVKWHTQIGTDGSIRGGNQGVEIRTAPAMGSRFVTQLGQVVQAINQAKGFANSSCGLHVHVGVKEDLNKHATDVYGKLLMVFWEIEDVMYQLVAENRSIVSMPNGDSAPGYYCQKLKAQRDFASRVAAFKRSQFANHAYWAQIAALLTRYSGLNVMSAIRKYSTVEYRLHEGTVDRTVIIPWAMLCGALTDNILNTTDTASLVDWIKSIGPRNYLENIAPTNKVREYVLRKFDAYDKLHGTYKKIFPKVMARRRRRVQGRRAA